MCNFDEGQWCCFETEITNMVYCICQESYQAWQTACEYAYNQCQGSGCWEEYQSCLGDATYEYWGCLEETQGSLETQCWAQNMYGAWCEDLGIYGWEQCPSY